MHHSNIARKKPTAPACARNRAAILEVLQMTFKSAEHVLEIGSGTGEHGVYFAEQLPWLQWQCSDVQENLDGIRLWVEDAGLTNLLKPIELDVSQTSLEGYFDAFFTANTLHIMSEQHVEDFFSVIQRLSSAHSELVIYGPFNYNGKFTSESNAKFELWLKERNPLSGIRDFEWITSLAEQAGFQLNHDREMPANNRCLHFSK